MIDVEIKIQEVCELLAKLSPLDAYALRYSIANLYAQANSASVKAREYKNSHTHTQLSLFDA